jgi:hypothetical protein
MRNHVATLLVMSLAAGAAHADVAEMVNQHVLLGYAARATATAQVAAQSAQTCDPATLRPA